MAIVTISQIKHRRGISGVPGTLGTQLASAEFGWSIDQRELYIGNGTVAEGAPSIGNTQILTEHSDLSVLVSDYTYTGPFPGAAMDTASAATAFSPWDRTSDEHNDDRVSVRAFNAVGDGATQDLEALKQAIYEHTSDAPASNRYWTTIYIPAGTYLINAPLQLPSRVRLVGDGAESTVIQMTSGSTAVLEIENNAVDSSPADVYIAGIQFQATQPESHVCSIGDAERIIFDRVTFTGASGDTTVVGQNKSCVLFNNSAAPTKGIRFLNCRFEQNTYAIASGIPDVGDTRQDISDVVVMNGVFDNLYKGVVLGNEVLGANDGPSGWRVTASVFDNITREGIHCFETTRFTSGMNHFADVGNLQTATPTYSAIVLGDSGGLDPTVVSVADYEGNNSIGDTFDRTDADDATIQRITTNCYNSYVIDPSSIRYGSLTVEPGRLIRITQNTSGATGVTIDSTLYTGAVIDYQIDRGGELRKTGTFTIGVGSSVSAVTHSFSEDFVEVDPTGVVFSSTAAGGVITVNHTTTAGNDAIFSYSIRHLSCLLVTP